MRAGFHLNPPYCSERCRTGGSQIVCRTSKTPATLVGDWCHCGVCERKPLKPVNGDKPEKEESGVCKMLIQNLSQERENVTIANNVLHYGLVPKQGERRATPSA